jgi:hypothetical protein
MFSKKNRREIGWIFLFYIKPLHMKHILLLIFSASVAICNAQTQRIKELIPKDGDINASQYSKEQENMRAQWSTVEIGKELILLSVNGKQCFIKGITPLWHVVQRQKITCMEIVTDQKIITSYSKDPTIKKLIIVETNE